VSVSLNKIANVLGIRSQSDLKGALAAHREAHEIVRELSAEEPGNIQWQSDLTLTKDGGALILTNIGNVLKDQIDLAGAIAAYLEVLDIRRDIAAKDSSNTQRQFNVVASLANLFLAGDHPRERLEESMVILKRLQAQSQLSTQQQAWIGITEAELAKLRLADTAPSSTVEQIQGTYVGTNNHSPIGATTIARAVEDKITLKFQQADSNVTATFLTSQGGRGKGTGTIAGKAINAMSLQSEIKNCPGSLTAALMFSDDIVSWTYTGQDCSGPVWGYGAAKKTEP
jgi:hypothetical protein